MKRFGTLVTGNACRFSVWAPEKDAMVLHLVEDNQKEYLMQKDDDGYFSVRIEGAGEGTRYFYKPGGDTDDTPDPGSDYQPDGVHGPSQVVDHEKYNWSDHNWKGIDLRESIFYEIHTGTFTEEGTFEAIIPRLDEIASTGINALQLMPVNQFPGTRNWGYDGVFPYSVQNSYGGPDGLKKLINECHRKNIAVFLDVVYNHLGPEGNYFSRFGPYFTPKYKIPWGDAINFDDEWSDGVREFFSKNPVHWFINYHLDGLRVDAIHEIYDNGAVHFWELTMEELRQAEAKSGRRFHMIAEADYNSPRVIRPAETGGYAFDAMWLDDFHHALYVFIHPEGKNRYKDFRSIEQVAKAYKEGFVHSGDVVKFRKKKHGRSSAGIPGNKFIVFNQNHDQVGNRVNGERLSRLVGFEQLKLAAAALMLSPYIPLLFMGEEYGEQTPFCYFVSHGDEDLVKAVREGRKKEFEGYKWNTDPPDPQDENTFHASKIKWNEKASGVKRILLDWNKELISLRRNRSALKNSSKDSLQVYVTNNHGLTLVRTNEHGREYLLAFFNFSGDEIMFYIPSLLVKWIKLIDSKDAKWNEKMDGTIKDPPSPLTLDGGQYFKASGWSISLYAGVTESN